jgi:hypothetical protein
VVTTVPALLAQMRIRGGGQAVGEAWTIHPRADQSTNARNGRVPEKCNVNRVEEISGLNEVRYEAGVCTV